MIAAYYTETFLHHIKIKNMKKKNLIYGVLVIFLFSAIISCSKSKSSPSTSTTPVTTGDTTITKILKPDANNYLLASVDAVPISNLDYIELVEGDSSGVVTLLQLNISYNITPSDTAVIAVTFFYPGKLGTTTIDMQKSPSAAVSFAPDISNILNSYYAAGIAYPGSSGTITITANDAINKKISGTFDNVVAYSPGSSSGSNNVNITGGSFSVSY
jgi:hypothetical protein